MTTKQIDVRGAHCPGPLLELIAALKLVDVGDRIEILCSDKGSQKDIPEWVAKVGHHMGDMLEEDGYWRINVIKTK